MSRPTSEHPTELELQVLKILWKESPLMVRDVRAALADLGRPLAHTSVITTLNTMVAKGYLKRKKQGKAFLFLPAVSEQSVTGRMLKDVIERVFDGSASSVMLRLLDATDVDAEQLKELRKIINQKMKEQDP